MIHKHHITVPVIALLLGLLSAPYRAVAADCTGGTAPAVEGTTLSDCYERTITIGGNSRTIRVWYTTDTSTYTVDGKSYVHGVTGQSQAIDVADAVQEAWETVFVHSAIGGHTAHEPYLNGCGSVLNIQLRDGKGWSGIAYWASSGSCRIGIDAPMISNGVGTGDDGVIFHEVQHYVQFSYDGGCYAAFKPLYGAGNDWIDGWANLAGKNATNATVDADYSVASYNSSNSYYDLSYTDLHAQYLLEQYGGNGAPADPEYRVEEVYEHYRQCDLYDDVYVMNETIMALTGGAKNEKWAFVDFEAAYYAYPYPDPDTQPELLWPDADDKPTATPAFAQDVSMSGGSQNWVESSPEDWTGRYYRITPQAGCEFVELRVETQPLGGEIGINFMAADTITPSLQRSAHIGDNAARLFAGFPATDELVVNVCSFDSAMTYEVTATCITPTLNILTPIHNPGHAMVGDPASPLATLTRFEVTSAGLPVSGIDAAAMSFDAEGDAATLVAGSFQEVGPGEYWAVIIPPTKAAGTTFVDYEVCLDTTICDSELDALLYVDPGNVDTVYVFDESGSMNTEDTPGEGRRIDNAKKAGKVLPDLLKDGDRLGIIGHGGLDNPMDCGLPFGDGNCANGNIVRLGRIDDVSVPGDIAVARAAVDSVTDRVVWTNTGQGLIDAKDMLLANPGNTNPDHIILLSDGQENTNPLYNTTAVRGALQLAGVCVDTIGLGPEAPGALLAQIAAENCGTYMPVPTSGLGPSVNAVRSAQGRLEAMGAPEELAVRMAQYVAADVYPAQLGIANANEYIDVASQDAARVFHFLHRDVPTKNYSTHFAVIDRSVSRFQFLAAGKQPDNQGVRWVDLLIPGMDPAGPWIPISPATAATPADWDIRNDAYQDVVLVKDPRPGTWGFRVRYAEVPGDYIMNLAVESPIRLEGNLLNLNAGRGKAGDVVPIVATLVDRSGLIPGASMAATITNEGGTDVTMLFDDGNHHDGVAGDGIHGFPYSLTNHGGSYAVRIVATFPNPAEPTEELEREWNGAFWIDGPVPGGEGEYEGDRDQDGMPDDWERRCKLIVGQNDAAVDNDRDGLSNIAELNRGTSPCRADTDRGGERDGSEVEAGRNPLFAADDNAFRVHAITVQPLNERALISWSQRADTHANVRVCVSDVAGDIGDCQDMGNEGDFVLPGLVNGRMYYLTLYGEGQDGAEGTYSDQVPVTPAEDPIPPLGAFFIGGPNVIEGGGVANARDVVLFVDAADPDSAFEGPTGLTSPSGSLGLLGPQYRGLFQASGNVEMRFSNDLRGIGGAPWEALSSSRNWTLDCPSGAICTVYGQFRDGAKNESKIVDEQIRLLLGGQPGDIDGDGVEDAADACPNTPTGETPDAEGCSCSQRDSDEDGVNDCDDLCPATPLTEEVDVDGCSSSQSTCGACGSTGLLTFALMFLGLSAMRLRRR